MRPICATLVFLYGLYVIWGATGYIFDAKLIDGASPYYWALGSGTVGAALTLGCRRIAGWITEGLDGANALVDSKLRLGLMRLFGLYVLYSQALALAPWIVYLINPGDTGAYMQSGPEFSAYMKWKIFFHLVIAGFAAWLAIAPQSVERRLDRLAGDSNK